MFVSSSLILYRDSSKAVSIERVQANFGAFERDKGKNEIFPRLFCDLTHFRHFPNLLYLRK